MFPIEAFRGTVERFIGILKSLKIRHHLTGGVVSVAWGEPRMTQDIDIVIDRVGATANIERLVSEIQSAGYFADEQGIRNAIHGGKPFQLLDQVEVLKLDVYPRELVPGELSRSVLAEVFPGSTIAIVSRPDAALSKLIWIKRGSHKSRHDLRQIVRRLSEEENVFLRTQALQLELTDLLDSVLAESDELFE
ncbi:MAG: nucleotidyl transferase AbiEii/AbiGii toxin family protein [Planctomyces sp.]|nr:nucleotidyl transferase AbiEii/AbiGii toxin family protein [Planctomyces sp.]